MKRNPTNHDPRNLSRRDILRGVGAAIALPWLESLAAASDARPAGPPQRFACFYIANGVRGWDATQHPGGRIELQRGLAPFADLTAEINVIKGLQHRDVLRAPGIKTHGSLGPVVLSGVPVHHSTTDVRAGATLDQILAERIGGETLQPSMVLGVESPCPGVDSNLSSVYLNNISWTSPTRPASREIHPALAFDSMFSSGANRDRTRSVLDAVLEDARGLERQISDSDRRRLDEYLTSVRDVERRIDRLGQPAAAGSWRPALNEPNMPRPADHIPERLADHMRLMLDLIVLAFRMDRTRIATLMFNNERSQQNFGFLPGVSSDAYHSVSHGGAGPHERITAFHSELVAEFLRKLQAADEGGASVLYNSQILFLSGMHDGNHSADRLPILLAGRAGGQLRTGRVLEYDSSPDRRMCRMLLSIAQNMGVRLPRLGDAEQPFDELC